VEDKHSCPPTYLAAIRPLQPAGGFIVAFALVPRLARVPCKVEASRVGLRQETRADSTPAGSVREHRRAQGPRVAGQAAAKRCRDGTQAQCSKPPMVHAAALKTSPGQGHANSCSTPASCIPAPAHLVGTSCWPALAAPWRDPACTRSHGRSSRTAEQAGGRPGGRRCILISMARRA